MTRLEKLMDDYYDTLTAHKIKLDIVYNTLVDIWGKSKKPKTIKLAEEKEYTNGIPVIFNREKLYVVELYLTKDEVHIHLCNHQTDTFVVNEIQWYGNHDLKTLVIDEVAKHLGYSFEIGGENKETKKKKKK